MRGSSGPISSRMSTNSWRAVVVVLDPIEQRVELGVVVVGAASSPSRAAAGDLARAARSRGSARAAPAPPRASPRSTSSSARATTASSLPGSISSACAQAGLVAGGDAARRPRSPPRSGSRLLDELLHDVLGLGADEAVDDLAVAGSRTRPGSTAPGTPGDAAGCRRRRPWRARPCRRSRRRPARGSGRASCTARTTRAHRSTTTGVVFERSMTSVSKVASVTSMAMRRTYRTLPTEPSPTGLRLPVADAMTVAPMSRRCRGSTSHTVTAWFEANVAGAQGPFAFELIAGGHSNLTYGVTGADGATLRAAPAAARPRARQRPRHGPRAPDHRRPRRPRRCPVPPALGFCDDPPSTARRST